MDEKKQDKKSDRLFRWIFAALFLLAMAIVQPAAGQEDDEEDEEPVKVASGNKMQTDSFSHNTFEFSTFTSDPSELTGEAGASGFVQLPVYGRTKIGENNTALPVNRVYFNYKHFENALQSRVENDIGTQMYSRDFSVERYNVGFERTFNDGRWSLEMRLPVIRDVDYYHTGIAKRLGGIGNLSVIAKRIIYETPTSVWSAGLGVSTPTGVSSQIQVGHELFTIKNQAVHLFPFVAFLSAPTERRFYQGFFQLDVPLNGNQVWSEDLSGAYPNTNQGSVRDQVLLYVDLLAGYWIYRNPNARVINGTAAAVELHYTTTLEDTRTLSGATCPCTTFRLSNVENRIDVVNCNVGFYTTWFNRYVTYTGIVSPFDDGTGRFFDLEAQFSLTLTY